MIWPWTEIRRLKRQLADAEKLLERARWREQLFRAEYLNFQKAVRGAHKGIWRLKEKLKKQSTNKLHCG